MDSQAELGEADSTFIFAARLRYLDGFARLWPSARRAEPLRRRQQERISPVITSGGAPRFS